MTTYNCPRCGQRSTPEQCPTCGRGREPLLAQLDELDMALRALSPNAGSRGAVEAERLRVLDELRRLAASYHAQSTPPAGTAPPPMATPTVPPAPPAGPRTPPPATRAPVRSEVAPMTMQTLLLSLGGLLVAAAIVIFTAVAWRNLGDGGRLTILTGFTALMLAAPVALLRRGLRATAETFGALASLALWSSALAAYYLLLPDGASLTAEAVGTWTMLVLAALAAYRAGVATTAPAWAMLPLAAVGSAYAAAGEMVNAALLMVGSAVVLAAASWIVTNRPSHYPRSDRWASRLLMCASVVLTFLAGLRVAFGLSDALVPVVAAAVALLAAGNLLATIYARRSGATVMTMLIASAATTSLIVAAWVLSIRAGDPALIIPSLALLAALIAVLVGELAPSPAEPGQVASALAAMAALAAVAITAFDAPELSAHLGAVLVVALLALTLPDPLRTAMRRGAYIGGAGIAFAGALIALLTLPQVWWNLDPTALLTWEVPIVLAVLAFAAVLVPRAWRLDVVAFALTFAAVASSGLLWHRADDDAVPISGFTLAAVIALITALASGTLAGRCTGWVMLTVWLPVTAGAFGASDGIDANALQIEFGLVVAAAVMLVVAAGAPRRSRPDRVLAAILAHVLAGTTVGIMMITDWFSQLISSSGTTRLLPAAIGVYTLALTGAALMAPLKQRAYAIAAFWTGTVGWWTLLTSYSVTPLEHYTVPPAALLFGAGVRRLSRSPQSGSWATLATAIGVGLGPSLLVALDDDGGALRRVAVGAAALALVILGVARRWQAPLVLGSVALLVLTINEVALLWHLIPKWAPLAVGGAILILAGATLEQRRRDFARLRGSLKSMR